MKENEVNQKLIDMINDNLMCFGPRKYGPNILLNKFISKENSLFAKKIKESKKDHTSQETTEETKIEETKEESDKNSSKATSTVTKINSKTQEMLNDFYKVSIDELNNAIAQGFDLATYAGPLCEEPLMGVCFIVEEFKYLEEQKKQEDAENPAETKIEETTVSQSNEKVNPEEREGEEASQQVKF
mmetsp:Transcript_20606/g.18018  ORF Transcript_20606/g.18018 Transcript_20606/m.18018 type:complete len:186 (-) Transcript_20606:551-1108(-)